eukprot:scaffold3131_cov64-Attheya_sp.AAC.7
MSSGWPHLHGGVGDAMRGKRKYWDKEYRGRGGIRENGGERDFTGKNGRVDVSQFANVEQIEAGSLMQRSLVKQMPEVV